MAIIPLEVVSEPRGLGTSGVVSLPVYCARLSASIAVPTGFFVKRAHDGVGQPRTPASLANVVLDTRAGTMNGCGKLTREVEEGVRILTDRPELRRLSYFAFVDTFGFSDRDLLASQRRWLLQVLGGGRRRAL